MGEAERKEVKKGLCVLLLIVTLIVAFFFVASDYADFDITNIQNKNLNDSIKKQ